MDGIVIILIAGVFSIFYKQKSAVVDIIEKEVISVNPGLNPTMYHDEGAFMEVAHGLGYT